MCLNCSPPLTNVRGGDILYARFLIRYRDADKIECFIFDYKPIKKG